MPVNLIDPLIQANRQRSQDMVELGTMIKNIRNYNRVKKLGTAVAKSYFSGELDPNNPQSFGTNLGKIAEETGSSQAEVFHVVSTFGKTLQELQAPSRSTELALDMLKNSGVVNESTAKNIEKQLGVVLPNISQGQSQPTENNTGLELQTPEQPTEGTGSFVETLTKLVGEDQNSTTEQNLYGLPQQADADRTITTWTGPDGEVIHLPNNVAPPRGSVPYSSGGTIKTWIGPNGNLIHLPSNKTPPSGSVPYSTGMDIDVGPEGTHIRTGVSGLSGGAAQRKTETRISDKLFDVQESISRLDNIADSYEPRFLQVGTRVNSLWTSVREKMGDTPVRKWVDLSISDEDKKTLGDYSAFRREGLENVNLYIKEITGAQMSVKEADRLKSAMPDPGDGILNGDSPTVFESKWESTMKALKTNQARYIYYLKDGFTPEQVAKLAQQGNLMPLSDVRKKMNERGKELEKQGLKAPQIKIKLLQEFFSMD